jgi:protein-disulfide isomerase
MVRFGLRQFVLAAIAAPLVLGLAACGKGEGEAGGLSGDPIAAVPAPAGKSWGDVVSKTPEGGYRMGNPEAPIKLIEFGSLTCPHCAEFAETSGEELREKFVNSGRVSFEFRNFVRDPIDLTTAQLTRCGAPESFFALTEQVFAYQPKIFEKAQAAGEAAYSNAMALPEDKRGIALGQITGLTEFVASRGIAVDQANACLADGASARALAKAAQDQGTKFEIQGTPTFLINGAKTDINTWEQVKAALENAGAR